MCVGERKETERNGYVEEMMLGVRRVRSWTAMHMQGKRIAINLVSVVEAEGVR